jgi:hypothetical protein
VDHVVPVSRGSQDDKSILVTTLQLRNSAKRNWLLSKIGWELYPPGDLASWDGLAGWCLGQVKADPTHTKHPAIFRWLAAVKRAA